MRPRALVGMVLMTMVILLGTNGAANAGAQAGPVGKPRGTPTAQSFHGVPTVGVLFPPGSLVHTCTASVIDSHTGNLLITAGHCISGTGKGYIFAPGYHDGIEPFGSWVVVGAYGAPGWIADQTPQRDFAFLAVAPRQVDGRIEQIQSVTGANQLGIAPASGERVKVPAYATGRDDDPLTCINRVDYHGRFPAFACNPYPGGTSGAPWLHRTGHGWTVVGIIGGLHQGGCYPWISYSPAFGAVTARTRADAEVSADASIFPSPSGDGCSAAP